MVQFIEMPRFMRDYYSLFFTKFTGYNGGTLNKRWVQKVRLRTEPHKAISSPS